MKEMMKRLADNLEKMDAQITDLQHRVKTLTQTSEGYHKSGADSSKYIAEMS